MKQDDEEFIRIMEAKQHKLIANPNNPIILVSKLSNKKLVHLKPVAVSPTKPTLSNKRTALTSSTRLPAYITFGRYLIETWYSSPYPHEYVQKQVLHICEFCLKYVKTQRVLDLHIQKKCCMLKETIQNSLSSPVKCSAGQLGRHRASPLNKMSSIPLTTGQVLGGSNSYCLPSNALWYFLFLIYKNSRKLKIFQNLYIFIILDKDSPLSAW